MDDLYKQAIQLIEGEDVQGVYSLNGTQIEYKTYALNWIVRVKKSGVLTGLQLLAVILHIIDDHTDQSRDARKIVDCWAVEISAALEAKILIARNRDSLLPLIGKPNDWEWVLRLSDADDFVVLHGMEWKISSEVEHLFNYFVSDESGSISDYDDAPDASSSYSTHDLNILVQAKREFWDNHDESQPPKKEVVTTWLTEKGVSKKIADAIDTILRSVKARKGGNKRLSSQPPAKNENKRSM